ncbi:MAG: PadR family transcriptional regulator [Bacillota bacterium]
MNTQFKKGVLDLCVLALLKKKDAYGYELAEKVSKSIQIAEGTLYPLLRKLKEDGLCETYLSDESGGPPRKYYRLTEAGMRAEAQLKQDWIEFTDSVRSLMEDIENE